MVVEVAVLESGTHMGVDLKVVKNTFIVTDEDAKTDGVIDEAKLIPFCAFLVNADQDDIQVVTGNKGEQFVTQEITSVMVDSTSHRDSTLRL